MDMGKITRDRFGLCCLVNRRHASSRHMESSSILIRTCMLCECGCMAWTSACALPIAFRTASKVHRVHTGHGCCSWPYSSHILTHMHGATVAPPALLASLLASLLSLLFYCFICKRRKRCCNCTLSLCLSKSPYVHFLLQYLRTRDTNWSTNSFIVNRLRSGRGNGVRLQEGHHIGSTEAMIAT